MSDEVERRIEAAAQEAARQKQAKEFLDSLTKDTELVKPIYNPEAYVMREKFIGAAKRGELPRTDCDHPLNYMQQYVDDDGQRGGRPDLVGKPVNLFICGICTTPLWLVDPWGEVVNDA